MPVKCKNGTCIAGKRLSRKKFSKMIPEHKKFIEPFAGNAWVAKQCLLDGKCKKENVFVSDINCGVTGHMKKEYGPNYSCGADYKELIKKHDDKDSFFFLDPPYPNACKLGYYGKHCDVNHEELKEEMKKIKGKFIMTTGVDQKKNFCKDFKCKVVTSKGMFGRELKDLSVSNF